MANNTLPQLAQEKICLVCDTDEEGQALLRHLQRHRAAVTRFWPPQERIGENADIVLCEYFPRMGGRLAWVPGEPCAALIILLPQTGRYDLAEIRAACPDAVLHRPYVAHAIDVSLTVALDHFGYNKRQRLRIARLEENGRAMRDIEKAKQVIMSSKNVGEQEAYRILRDIAMKRRLPVATVAGKFVDAAENLF
ncbi:hypothetical protein BH10PSE7_BH10PSE7_12380 [soil metagenome]